MLLDWTRNFPFQQSVCVLDIHIGGGGLTVCVCVCVCFCLLYHLLIMELISIILVVF